VNSCNAGSTGALVRVGTCYRFINLYLSSALFPYFFENGSVGVCKLTLKGFGVGKISKMAVSQ